MGTRLWLLSDLHQEFVRDSRYGSHELTSFDPARVSPPNFDVVVLAGDVDVPLTRSIEWARSRFPGVPVVYVPGNHDFYNEADRPLRTMEELQAEGRDAAARLGVHLLMDDAINIGEVRFIGGTLWSDFNIGAGSRSAKMAEAAGKNGMNDYRAIKRWSSKQPDKRKNARPEDTIMAHQLTRQFIKSELESLPKNTVSVVVTRHAPLSNALPSSNGLPWCYASQLDEMFEETRAPDLWLHGQIHAPVDYINGKTRVVSNPRGYAFAGEPGFDRFDPGLVLEVPFGPVA
jgi:Icc-related predicted phosphoesterase